MSIDRLSGFLLWCNGLHVSVLALWWLAWTLAADRIHRLHSRWFRLERADYDAALFRLLGTYKIGVWLFFIIPWIALQAIRP